MAKHKIEVSESVTENLFREYYGSTEFIEKSAIPKQFGFKSKNKTSFSGYPDFFKELDDFLIVVEAKAINHKDAISEVKHYMTYNKIKKDIVGIAVTGQTIDTLEFNILIKFRDSNECTVLAPDKLISLDNIKKLFWKIKNKESVTSEHLTKVLKQLNETFNNNNKIRDTDRSLFFSGLMIALKDNTFRNTYQHIEAPTDEDISTVNNTVLESHNLNTAIINAISTQLVNKINNLSKEFSWRDKFSFIKNIDFSLLEYKEIIKTIEDNIFIPFKNDEKQDILGKAYKIFLSKAGKIDNKNIILTPDHIKSLMIRLARLSINDVVIDTCTGTGGFLMEAMEILVSKAKDNTTTIDNIKEKQLIGFEIDSVLFALACSNMFLHGDGRSNLLFRSSLLNDSEEHIVNNKDVLLFDYIKKMKPTKCIINPPYEQNNSIKFTFQALKYLETNGKLIIIMPTPTLVKNQNGITEKILEIAKLDFVIRMPSNLFSEQKRTVNTSIFGFTKNAHEENDDVLFYSLEDDGLVSIQHRGRQDIHNKWAETQSNILDFIANHREEDNICEKRKIYKNGILNASGIQVNNNSDKSEMIKITQLFDISKGTLASEKSIAGEFDFLTGSEDWKTHNDYSNDCEALVFVVQAAGSLGRCHYVNGKFIASNLCLILVLKEKPEYEINLKFYNMYFKKIRKKIVYDLADGTSKLTIGEPIFKDYYIDYIDIDKQNDFVNNYVKPYEKQVRKLDNAVEKAKIELNTKLDNLL